MSRAAIVATIVTGILAFSSTCFAASDEEQLGKLGDKMSGAFRCSIYAAMSHDLKEQQRLFQIGLKAARDFAEGMKSRNDPMTDLQKYMPGASTDFVVGRMYESEYTNVNNEIPLDQRADPSAAKTQGEINYRKSNCSLIN